MRCGENKVGCSINIEHLLGHNTSSFRVGGILTSGASEEGLRRRIQSPYNLYFQKMGTTYILSSKRNGTLYVGVTSDMHKRVYQHKHGETAGFTKKHGINQLVWYQEFATIDEAIVFEKKIKGKSRAYKIQLIEEKNQHRVDLAMNWFN